MNGKIYLLPSPLGDSSIEKIVPNEVIKTTLVLRYFMVENIRTARRYLRQLDKQFPIDESIFFELNKHTLPKEIEGFLINCEKGFSIGIMSEAGVPGVADPGAEVVSLAHRRNLQVIPLVGPSSILMAIMASGLNGQNFAFNGYLPIKNDKRIKQIKLLEQRSLKENQAQAFIETPYRNDVLLSDLLKTCLPETKLCIAANISCEGELIKTKTVKDWKTQKPVLNKIPTLFVLGL